jgi:hypothetical protein
MSLSVKQGPLQPRDDNLHIGRYQPISRSMTGRGRMKRQEPVTTQAFAWKRLCV